MQDSAVFIKKLGEQVEKEISGILEKANAEKTEILTASLKAADRFKTSPIEELKDIEMACKMAVSSKRSSGGGKKVNAKAIKLAQSNIGRVFVDAGKALNKLVAAPEYEKALAVMFTEAVSDVSGDIVLSANKKDMPVIKELASKIKTSVELKTDESIIGGLIVTSKGGRIRNVNTLSSRLNRLKNFIIKDVNKVLHDKNN